MSFDALPNYLLAIILNDSHIRLQERIKLRAVSSQWLAIIEEELKKDCLTKLVLRDHRDHRALVPVNANDLVVSDAKYFNDEFFQLLLRLFPSVSELIVDINSIESFHQLPGLLSAYSSTLSSFSLYGNYTFRKETSKSVVLKVNDGKMKKYPQLNSLIEVSKQINAACSVLNAVTALHPNRDISHLRERTISPLLDFLAQISTRSFLRLPEKYRQVIESIFNNALGDRCASLDQNRANLVQWPENTTFDCSVTDLKIQGPFDLFTMLPMFMSLQKLSVDFSNIQSEDGERFVDVRLSNIIPTSMVPLRQLTDLRLLNLSYKKYALRRPKGMIPGPSWHNPGIIELPLTSIKRLYLSLTIFEEGKNFDGKHFCSTIASWFPRLEHLTICCDEAFHDDIFGKDHLEAFMNLVNADFVPREFQTESTDDE